MVVVYDDEEHYQLKYEWSGFIEAAFYGPTDETLL